MIKIRNGTFETNSSSVHTLVIGNEKPHIQPMDFETDEYGCEHNVISDPKGRAKYFYTALLEYHPLSERSLHYLLPDGYWRDRDVNTDTEYAIEITRCMLPTEIHDKCLFSDGLGVWDGIDHTDELRDLIEDFAKHPDKFLRFIFSDDSCIYTGNDNEEECYEIDAGDREVYEKGN